MLSGCRAGRKPKALSSTACGSNDGASARAGTRSGNQAKARLNADQTVRCAFIASSTAGIIPKKPWIIPG
jgi:hypothetical protein